MPRLLRRLAALATLLLALLGITLLALRGMGVDLAVGPLASPTPPGSATPTASARPSASADSRRQFAEIETQVRGLRGLSAPSLGEPQIVTRAQLDAELRSRFDRDYPPARRAADNLLLHALGLLTPDQDIGELQLRLLSGQVIGFYDDRTKHMTLVSDGGIGAQVKITYAHEYTHALQDKTFGLASFQLYAPGEDDRDLARLSLVEGDATSVMYLWAIDHLTSEELVGLGQTPLPNMTGIPAWMVAQLELPYTAGTAFVSRLEASGGWSAVDAAFRTPPASTEQILHYDKYVAGEQAVKVAAPALARVLGSGWREVPADTLGEAMIGIWLQGLGLAHDDAQSAAEGWGGDRVVAASGPNGARAVAWRLAWDAPGDVTQFIQAYRGLVAQRGLTAQVVQLTDRETLVVQASSKAVLDRAVAALR